MLPLMVVALALAYVVARDRKAVLWAVMLPLVLVGLSYVAYEPLRHVWVVMLSAVMAFAWVWIRGGARVAWE